MDYRDNGRKRREKGSRVLLAVAAAVLIPVSVPVVYLFLGEDEAARTLGGVLEEGSGYASLVLLPAYPTLGPVKELLLFCTDFYRSFWNTAGYAGAISALQLAVAMPAAWALGQYRFRGKKVIFAVYLLMMMLPFQVTMVSNYLLLYKLSLLNTAWAILLPNIFSAFPVFLMTNFFEGIPRETLEAARMDGAGEFKLFLKIGIPMGKSGITAAFVLGFIEYWNMIEQPLAFLRNKELEPLSLFLPDFNRYTAGSVFAASAFSMILPVLVFLWGRKYLEEGISCLAVKR